MKKYLIDIYQLDQSIYLYLILSIDPSDYPSIYRYTYISVYPSIYNIIYLSIFYLRVENGELEIASGSTSGELIFWKDVTETAKAKKQVNSKYFSELKIR